MSWSIEEHIGEGRPWPEQVVVYRGETDESLTYARRSLSDVNQMVELMDTLAAENAKLRELCAGLLTGYECGYGELCKGCTWDGIGDSKTFSCLPRAKARELGVEVDDG